jgi:hypothetical protein
VKKNAAQISAIVAISFLYVGCNKPDASPSPPTIDSSSPAIASARAIPSADAVDASRPEATVQSPSELFERAAPLSGKSVGHTSVVFKLKLDGDLQAAFKPQSKRGGSRYKGEIGAYRLAKALGIDNVPLALPRWFTKSALRTAIAKGPSLPLFDEEVIVNREGNVQGALIPWIDKLDFLPLESGEWMAKWKKWLAFNASSDAAVDANSDLAPQISTMLVFDAVTGNWDRWSGGNVGFDAKTRQILFIDNDGAFFDVVPAAAFNAQISKINACDRYSKKFVAALRAIDAEKLENAFGDEDGAPLYEPRIILAAIERKTKVLAIIDAKIAKLGEANVLAFQ